MAGVWHEGPEYAVIDAQIGYRILTPADIIAFVDKIKEHELKLLQLQQENGLDESLVSSVYLLVAPCIKIHDPQGDESTNVFVGPSRVLGFPGLGSSDYMRFKRLQTAALITRDAAVSSFLAIHVENTLQQLMQYVCEVHRDKLGDRLGRYPFTLSFIGSRLIAANVDVTNDLKLGYKLSDEPELQTPPLENNVAIVSTLWSQIYEDVEEETAKAQSARKNKGQIKRKKVCKSNGKNKRRKK